MNYFTPETYPNRDQNASIDAVETIIYPSSPSGTTFFLRNVWLYKKDPRGGFFFEYTLNGCSAPSATSSAAWPNKHKQNGSDIETLIPNDAWYPFAFFFRAS